MFRKAIKQILPSPIIRLGRAARRRIYELIELRPILTPPPLTHEAVFYEETSAVDVTMLIGTAAGLLLYLHGRLTKLLDGFVYGITHCRGLWYVYRRHVTRHTQRAIGQILTSDLFDEQNAGSLRIAANWLDESIHQVDAWGAISLPWILPTIAS